MTMATKLPPSKYLKTDSIVAFDVSIQCMLEFYNFPLYCGGTVRGDPDGEYEYVSAVDPNGVSNYVMGKRLCAGLCGRLVKSAQHWWESYVRDNKPKPNCGQKHISVGSVPHNVVEVSLYDLLHDHFSSDMDALKAELELERFTWKPFGKDGMDVVVFGDYVERLLWHAGVNARFQRIRVIRDCLPAKFREMVHMVKTETQLWEAIKVACPTFVVDYIGRQRTSRRGTSYSKPVEENRHHTVNGTTTTNSSSKPAAVTSMRNKRSFRCGKEDHMVKNCLVISTPISFVQQVGGTPFYGLPSITPVVDMGPLKQEVVIPEEVVILEELEIVEKVVIPEGVVVDSVPVFTVVMSPIIQEDLAAIIQEDLAEELDAAPEEVDHADFEDKYMRELALFAGGSENITISLPEMMFGGEHGRDLPKSGIQEEVTCGKACEGEILVVEGEDTLHAESEAQFLNTSDMNPHDMNSNDLNTHDVNTHNTKTYGLEFQDAWVKVVLLQDLCGKYKIIKDIAVDFDHEMIKSSDSRECGRKRARRCKRRLRRISGKRFRTPVDGMGCYTVYSDYE